jgi:two-component system, NtrC family, sensor histidine kinase GlrK
MRVSTKTVSGFGILFVLACIGLAYQVSVLHQMQSINRDLSAVNFRSASTALRTMQLSDTLEEFTQKFFATGDPIYEHQLEGVAQEFLTNIADMRSTVRTDRERAEVQRLGLTFDEFQKGLADLKQPLKKQEHEPGYLPNELASTLDRLKAQTRTTGDAVQLSIRDEVNRAALAGQNAERFSWTAGIVALLLGIFVTIVLVRSINDPLHNLTQGTHQIAKGQFWHRLPVKGDDEFAELARDFNAMSEKLGELDEMKKDFVSHVSHELKAPLASIRQVLHILLQEIPGTVNDQQRDLLRLSYNSAERLSAMVGNLLDVSRMEAGTMEYEIAVHDLIPIIRMVTDEFEVQARNKNIRLHLDYDHKSTYVDCDRDRIAQVVGNLYENALKFSPSNSEIVTRMHPSEDGRRIVVSVTDSGPGIPDAHKDRIFQKFHQVKRGKLTGQGVGLGLTICKTIIEAHHGHIWVEDNPTGGSVFSFSLGAAVREEAIKCQQSV